MGEDYIEREFNVPAANVRRNGAKLFEIVKEKVSSFEFRVSSSEIDGASKELVAASSSTTRNSE
mgnify:CR=1 FL=1